MRKKMTTTKLSRTFKATWLDCLTKDLSIHLREGKRTTLIVSKSGRKLLATILENTDY